MTLRTAAAIGVENLVWHGGLVEVIYCRGISCLECSVFVCGGGRVAMWISCNAKLYGREFKRDFGQGRGGAFLFSFSRVLIKTVLEDRVAVSIQAL